MSCSSSLRVSAASSGVRNFFDEEDDDDPIDDGIAGPIDDDPIDDVIDTSSEWRVCLMEFMSRPWSTCCIPIRTNCVTYWPNMAGFAAMSWSTTSVIIMWGDTLGVLLRGVVC